MLKSPASATYGGMDARSALQDSLFCMMDVLGAVSGNNVASEAVGR